MYGYGYRYPRVPRKVEILYDDTNYRYKWTRSAIMNRGVAAQGPWIAFLRKKGTLEEIAQKLCEAGQEYRALYSVKPKYKTTAERRMNKIDKAIKAIRNESIQNRLQAEFGDKFNKVYVDDALRVLENELAHLKTLVEWKGAPQQPPPQSSALEKKASGYGLREGLGYGYFY